MRQQLKGTKSRWYFKLKQHTTNWILQFYDPPSKSSNFWKYRNFNVKPVYWFERILIRHDSHFILYHWLCINIFKQQIMWLKALLFSWHCPCTFILAEDRSFMLFLKRSASLNHRSSFYKVNTCLPRPPHEFGGHEEDTEANSEAGKVSPLVLTPSEGLQVI